AVVTRSGRSSPIPLDPAAKDPTIFRSLLYFPDHDHCFYGQQAIVEYQENTGKGRFIRSIKKFLPSQSFLGSWIENRLVRLEDLIGLFLLELKRRAETHLNQKIDRVL